MATCGRLVLLPCPLIRASTRQFNPSCRRSFISSQPTLTETRQRHRNPETTTLATVNSYRNLVNTSFSTSSFIDQHDHFCKKRVQPFTICISRYLSTESSSNAKKKKRKGKKKKKEGKKNNESLEHKEKMPLRKLASPFLLLCHPDKFTADDHETTSTARTVNLEAVQTLNGLIDTIESASSSPSGFGLEIKAKYEVEFMVPSSGGKKKATQLISKSGNEMFTRKSVCLTFPDSVRNMQTDLDGTVRKDSGVLMSRARQEIGKLLGAAGLPVPKELSGRLDYSSDDVRDELGLHSGEPGNRSTNGGVVIGSQEWRSGFQINWDKEFKRYEAAEKAMEMDIATVGMTDEKRKHKIVANIIGRVRFLGEMSVIDQLVALRRISLILEDNFDNLGMEDFGRLWESIVIVLRAEHEGQIVPMDTPVGSRSTNKKPKGETGFKFSFGGDGRITATVPANFLDMQLIDEFKQHLRDFHQEDYELL